MDDDESSYLQLIMLLPYHDFTRIATAPLGMPWVHYKSRYILDLDTFGLG